MEKKIKLLKILFYIGLLIRTLLLFQFQYRPTLLVRLLPEILRIGFLDVILWRRYVAFPYQNIFICQERLQRRCWLILQINGCRGPGAVRGPAWGPGREVGQFQRGFWDHGGPAWNWASAWHWFQFGLQPCPITTVHYRLKWIRPFFIYIYILETDPLIVAKWKAQTHFLELIFLF